jgi:hypothetical protein
MSFKDNLKADARTFLNTDEFAENLTYIPHGGTAKVIKAVVTRGRIDPASGNFSRSLKNEAEVYIMNDETEGVTAIDKTNDRIVLKELDGDEKEARITEILNSDEGIWHIRVGW